MATKDEIINALLDKGFSYFEAVQALRERDIYDKEEDVFKDAKEIADRFK